MKKPNRRLKKIDKEIKIGEKFNNWTIISDVFIKNNYEYVKCKCLCNTIRDVLTASLKISMSKSCGKCNTKKLEIGAKFGKWTILKFSHYDKKKMSYFLCKCSCSTIRLVRGDILRKGISCSCGMCRYRQIKLGSENEMWRVIEEPKINYSVWRKNKILCENLYDKSIIKNVSCKDFVNDYCFYSRRLSKKYEIFRENVLNRDDYSCILCGNSKKSLNVHHIWAYSYNKDVRLSVDNGITLCLDCHKKYHRRFGPNATPHHWNEIYKNPQSLQEFLLFL